MEYLLNAEQMKACDTRTIRQIGIPSMVLMERAALAVVEEMDRSGMDLSRVLVVCGSGNNGGDGFAVARLLADRAEAEKDSAVEKTGGVTLAFVGKDSSMTEETASERKICEKCGIKISSNFMEGEYTTIVDAIFGIGLSRPVEGTHADVIRWINAQNSRVVSVDIPSGICADDGLVLGTAVCADLTVTFACRKIGQVLYPGTAYCGKVVCRKIGIRVDNPDPVSREQTDTELVFTYTDRDLDKLPGRVPYSNKASYGKVLLIAGSEGMSGAAALAARAAYRTGCGMVRVFTPECNRPVLQAYLPEAMVTTWDLQHVDLKVLSAVLAWSDAVGIGPGLGTSASAAEILAYVLNNYKNPLVIDADGLNLLAADTSLLAQARGRIVMTPHVGEMMRLTGKEKKEITEKILTCARDFAKEHQIVCALKDARTVVSDGEQIYLNTSGNDGMAVAGSGDVLTGVISALLAQGMPCFEAGALGVYLHGRAGDRARDDFGSYGMIAGDIAECTGRVLKDWK
ncbi:MAG: NAD(P)H-hydrate dehydratase, partial [Clostridiales bacterium]|nr:NAD(P)H-hydrate dehydratase [Clostridiales bacterium]